MAAPTNSAWPVAMTTGLGLRPEPHDDRVAEAVPAQCGQVTAGGQARPGGQVLDEHRDRTGRDGGPHEQVAVPGSRLEVGGEVSGIDVGDGGDERGAVEGQSTTPDGSADGGGRCEGRGCCGSSWPTSPRAGDGTENASPPSCQSGHVGDEAAHGERVHDVRRLAVPTRRSSARASRRTTPSSVLSTAQPPGHQYLHHHDPASPGPPGEVHRPAAVSELMAPNTVRTTPTPSATPPRNDTHTDGEHHTTVTPHLHKEPSTKGRSGHEPETRC